MSNEKRQAFKRGFTFKSKTNDGCAARVTVYEFGNYVLIEKLTVTREMPKNYLCKVVRKFKGYYVLLAKLSLKTDTFWYITEELFKADKS